MEEIRVTCDTLRVIFVVLCHCTLSMSFFNKIKG
jgi:hypothetical protein